MSHPLPTHEDIAARAYAIWEKCGRPHGCETEHWQRAERELFHDARQAAALHGEILKDGAPPSAGQGDEGETAH